MLSPMIGLLGTVFGIISSFGVLAAATLSQSRDVLLAGGVSEALVATATGLVLGIIAMAFYSLFRNRVQSLISDLEIASAHVWADRAELLTRSASSRASRWKRSFSVRGA